MNEASPLIPPSVSKGTASRLQQGLFSGFLGNIPIGWKMALMVFLLFLGILGITISALNGMQSLNYHIDNLYNFMLVPVASLGDADHGLSIMEYQTLKLQNPNLPQDEIDASIKALHESEKAFDEVFTTYKSEWITTGSPEFTAQLESVGRLDLQQDEVAIINAMQASYDEYKTASAAFMESIATGQGDVTHAQAVLETLGQLRNLNNRLIEVNKSFAQLSFETAEIDYNGALVRGGVTLAIAVVLSLLLSYLIVVSITSRLGDLTQSAIAMQHGQMDQKVMVKGSDEVSLLGNTFNAMSSQLTNLFTTLEERVAERTRDQATVADIATKTANIQDLQEMLATMVQLTQRGFGLYHVHVFLYREGTEDLQIVACGYKEGDEHEGTHGTSIIPLAQEQSLVARAGRTRQPVIVNDVRSDPGWLPNPLLPDTHAEMSVPMIVGDKLLGVLDVQAEQVDAFDEADATIQMTLAAQVAVAVQNILQFQTSQKMAADLGVVAEVGIVAATISDANRLLQEVVDLAKRSFNLYHTHIYLMDEAGDMLQLAAGAGEVGRQMAAEGRSIPLDSEKSLVARAARTREGVVVNDVTEDSDFLPNPLLPDTRAEMAVPMLVGGKVVGVLDVQSETIGRFTEIDVNIQTTLASQVAVALENARSFQEAQKQAEHETKLNLITQRIQGADTIEGALQIAARELGLALGKRQTLVSLDPSGLAGESKALVHE